MNRDFHHESLVPRRPHNVAPHGLGGVRLINVLHRYKTPTGNSDAGLSVTVSGTTRVLRQAGVDTETWGVNNTDDLRGKLERDRYGSERRVTHVVVNTPHLVLPVDFAELSERWQNIEFVMLGHTATSYLSIDGAVGVNKTRELLKLQAAKDNFKVAFNNERTVRSFHGSYRQPTTYLPNLYDTTTFVERTAHRKDPDPLRVGVFGVPRPWKNPIGASLAAIEMAEALGVRLEMYVNSDPWGRTYQDITSCRDQLFAGTRHKIISIGWKWWPEFRTRIADTDILLNPSFDETHCCIVADGIAEGVPSVVSGAMEWCPDSWKAPKPFDSAGVAAIGSSLLHNKSAAVYDGRHALKRHVSTGTHHWLDYLTRD